MGDGDSASDVRARDAARAARHIHIQNNARRSGNAQDAPRGRLIRGGEQGTTTAPPPKQSVGTGIRRREQTFAERGCAERYLRRAGGAGQEQLLADIADAQQRMAHGAGRIDNRC